MAETQYEALRRQGVSRRSFLQFCSLTAASLGLGSAGAKDIATAMQTKPRVPVVWLHGLECTCCTESFIRSYHPIAKDIVLSMVSLDYDDTIMQLPVNRLKRLSKTPLRSTRVSTSSRSKAMCLSPATARSASLAVKSSRTRSSTLLLAPRL